MDTQTLIIAALTVSLAINLSMAIVYWTRRSYPGFGYWLAGTLCRTLAGLLLLLPRDQFPPWLTIILANYLLLVELLLYLRGTRLFRGLPVSFRGEVIASVLFLGGFVYFTYRMPSLDARILVLAIFSGVLEFEMIRVLLTRRPAYFGSSDRWQAGVWAALMVSDLARAGHAWAFPSPLTDPLAMPLYPNLGLLLLMLAMLLIALSQIIMNAQRLEYDLRLTQERLEQDISQRREAEAKLRLSEERHRLLADNANDVIWTMGVDGTITYVSPAVERVRGYTPEEAMRQGIEEIHPPDSLAISLGYFQQLHARIQSGQPPENFRGELEYYCKDGSTFWTEVMAYPMRGPDGTIREIVGVTRDIAAHKAAQAQLQASEARMRRMLDQIPTAISVVSLTDEPRLIFLNEQFVRTFGYTPEEVPTLGAWAERAFPDPDYRAETLIGWNRAVAEARRGQGKVASRECKAACQDGRRRDVIISATLMDDLLLTSFVDITERKQMEEARRVSEERFRLLADNAVDNIWTLGLDRVFTYASPSIETLLGYTPEEFLRLALEDILTPPSLPTALAYLTSLEAAIKAGLPLKKFRRELELRHKDGATVWTEVIASPQLDAEGRIVALAGVTRDISERKRFETELLRARDATETANRALRDANEELNRLATTDTLTGVRNRRHFEAVATAEMARLDRYGEPLSLLLFDIDHFKAVNDRYGHLIGDQVLVTLTQRVRGQLRAVDVLARWGGEEFVVLLPHCGAEEARRLAEKLRALIAGEPFPTVGGVTTSFGVAECRAHETLDDWLKRADDALYRAKSGGRNRVC